MSGSRDERPPTPGALAAEMIGGEKESVAALSSAQDRAITRICRDLGGLIGPDACVALAGRALADARLRHPCLAHARLEGDRENLRFYYDDLEHAAPAAVLAAFEDVLTTFIEILGRFVGPELAIHIVLQGWRAKSVAGDKSR